MLTPILNTKPGVTFPDDEGQLEVTAWVAEDGAEDTPAYLRNAPHVQIDTDAIGFRGLVVHLNDGPPIYQGNPDVHESAAEVLRRVREALNGPAIDGERRRINALNIIRTSGVIL